MGIMRVNALHYHKIDNAVTKMINNHKQLQHQCSTKSDAEAGTQQASLTNWWRRWINYQGFILERWTRTLQPAMPDVYRAVITSFIIASRHATLSRNCRGCHLNTIHHHCLRASDPNARKSRFVPGYMEGRGLTQDRRHLLRAPVLSIAADTQDGAGAQIISIFRGGCQAVGERLMVCQMLPKGTHVWQACRTVRLHATLSQLC